MRRVTLVLLAAALFALAAPRGHDTRRVIGPWRSGTVVICDHGGRGQRSYRVEWRNALGASWSLLETGPERPRARLLANDTLAVGVVDPASPPGRERLLTRLWASPFAGPSVQAERTPVAYSAAPVAPREPTHRIAVEIEVPMVGVGEGY